MTHISGTPYTIGESQSMMGTPDVEPRSAGGLHVVVLQLEDVAEAKKAVAEALAEAELYKNRFLQERDLRRQLHNTLQVICAPPCAVCDTSVVAAVSTVARGA